MDASSSDSNPGRKICNVIRGSGDADITDRKELQERQGGNVPEREKKEHQEKEARERRERQERERLEHQEREKKQRQDRERLERQEREAREWRERQERERLEHREREKEERQEGGKKERQERGKKERQEREGLEHREREKEERQDRERRERQERERRERQERERRYQQERERRERQERERRQRQDRDRRYHKQGGKTIEGRETQVRCLVERETARERTRLQAREAIESQEEERRTRRWFRWLQIIEEQEQENGEQMEQQIQANVDVPPMGETRRMIEFFSQTEPPRGPLDARWGRRKFRFRLRVMENEIRNACKIRQLKTIEHQSERQQWLNNIDHDDDEGRGIQWRRLTDTYHPLPEHWEPMDAREKICVVLPDTGCEFRNVTSVFYADCKPLSAVHKKTPICHYRPQDIFQVTRVVRIQNPASYRRFKRKEDKMKLALQTSCVHKRTLFHGTQSANVDNICRKGFDPALSQNTTSGHLLGKGSYFTCHATYAHCFSTNLDHGARPTTTPGMVLEAKRAGDQNVKQDQCGDRERQEALCHYENQKQPPRAQLPPVVLHGTFGYDVSKVFDSPSPVTTGRDAEIEVWDSIYVNAVFSNRLQPHPQNWTILAGIDGRTNKFATKRPNAFRRTRLPPVGAPALPLPPDFAALESSRWTRVRKRADYLPRLSGIPLEYGKVFYPSHSIHPNLMRPGLPVVPEVNIPHPEPPEPAPVQLSSVSTQRRLYTINTASDFPHLLYPARPRSPEEEPRQTHQTVVASPQMTPNAAQTPRSEVQPSQAVPQPPRTEIQPSRAIPQPPRSEVLPSRLVLRPPRTEVQPSQTVPQPPRTEVQSPQAVPQPPRIKVQPSRAEPQPPRSEVQPPQAVPQPPRSKVQPSGAVSQPHRTKVQPSRLVLRPPRTEVQPSQAVPQPPRTEVQPSQAVPQPPRTEVQPSQAVPQPPRIKVQPSRAEPQPPRSEVQPPQTVPQPPRSEVQPPRAVPQPHRTEVQLSRAVPQPLRTEVQPSRAEPQSPRSEVQPPQAVPQPPRSEVQPSVAVSQPHRTEVQPSRAVPQPTRTEVQPSRAVPQPPRTEVQPSQAVPQPPRTEVQPSLAVPQPPRTEVQPSRAVPQPPRTEVQPSRAVPQPPRTEVQPSLAVPQPPRTEVQPSRAVPQPPRTEVQPSLAVPQPPRTEVQPSRAVPQPPRTEVQPSRAVPQPPRTEVQPSRAVPQPPRTEVQPSRAVPQPPRAEVQSSQVVSQPTKTAVLPVRSAEEASDHDPTLQSSPCVDRHEEQALGNGPFYMFQVQMLVGRYVQGNPSLLGPPRLQGTGGQLADSCVDDVQNPQMFVAYSSGQVYPEYLIEYYERPQFSELFQD